MRTILLNIPDSVDLKDQDIIMIVAAKLYKDAKFLARQTAEIVGLAQRSIY